MFDILMECVIHVLTFVCTRIYYFELLDEIYEHVLNDLLQYLSVFTFVHPIYTFIYRSLPLIRHILVYNLDHIYPHFAILIQFL